MNDRPMPVTVMAWILVVFAVFGLLSLVMSFAMRNEPLMQQYLQNMPMSFGVIMAVSAVGLAVQLVCVAGFFLRWNWARYLYVTWNLLGFLYGYWTSPFRGLMVVSLAIPIAVTVVLFLPDSNRWFTGKAGAPAAQ